MTPFEPQLGKYRLIAEIARGGMGIVYLAVVQGPGGFNKLSVVKELKPELSADPQFLDMFLDEARLAARLHHSSIVQTNEVGQEGSRFYIAMEYLEGRSLHRLLRKAMTVTRASELGPLSSSPPAYQCSCYYENKINGTPSNGCVACPNGNECASVPGRPSCNYGFCEATSD